MATPNIVPRVNGEGGIGTASKGWGKLFITNTTASSTSEGGKMILACNDGAAMATAHRLGVVEFKGAEDASGTLTIGARIEAVCDAGWSASENGASLKFFTTDGDATESNVLTLDSNKLASFRYGKVDIGADADGTDRTLTFGHATLKSVVGIDDDQDVFAINTDAAFEADNDLEIDANGNVSCNNGAVTGKNYRTIYIDAGSMVPSVTNGAQAGTEETATSTAMNDYYAFDTSTDEHVWFKMVMPAQYDGGTVKFKAYWRPKSSTTLTHDVTWSFISIAHDDGDDIATALSAGNIVVINDSVQDTNTKLHITAATPAHTIAGVSAGANDQLVWFRVSRDVSADDLNEDAYLFGVAIQYRESSTPDAIWS